MKRILCLILAVLLVLLPACAKKEKKKEDPGKSTSVLDKIGVIDIDSDPMKKMAADALNSLEDTKLSDKGITIFSCCDTEYVPESEGTVYSYSLAQRNRMFEKKYQTKLYQFSESSDLLLEEAYYNMLAGIGFADILTVPAKDLGRFARKGLLLNTTALPGADFSAEWFDSALMEKAAAGNENYAVYGDFNKDISSYYCLYANKTLFERTEQALPFDKIADGSWSWDALIEVCRNSNAVSPDTFVLSSEGASVNANAVFKSGGFDYIGSGYKKTPAAAFASDSSQKVIELLRSLNSAGHISDNTESFTSGNSLFMIGTVGDMNTVKYLRNSWCILPLPKTDAKAESYTAYMDENHSVVTCFAGASNASKLFYVLEGLNAASYGGYLTQAYYNSLIINSLRDSDTLNMLDYICGVKDGVQTTDFTDYYSAQIPELYEKTRDLLAEAATGDSIHIFAAEETTKKTLDPLLQNYFKY
ncbi:MAG: extracellular solute-binding protein [Ruminococcaceae bacterium]|nr:extracellular solute-binding protein [Oscillospiraceae bacterium]